MDTTAAALQAIGLYLVTNIDDIIVFHQLTQDQIIEMVDLMLNRVGNALKNKDMGLEVSDQAKSLLAKRGFDPVLGARPLRRTIQREIEDALSEKILFGEIAAGQIVEVDVEGWDGEGKGEDAKFTFAGKPKPAIDLEKSDDGEIRHLTKLDLWEAGPCLRGANPLAKLKSQDAPETDDAAQRTARARLALLGL